MKPSTLLMTLLVLANALLLAGGLVLYEEPSRDSLPLLGLTMARLACWRHGWHSVIHRPGFA